MADVFGGGGGGAGGGVGGVNDSVEALESLLSVAVSVAVLSEVDVDEDGLCG